MPPKMFYKNKPLYEFLETVEKQFIVLNTTITALNETNKVLSNKLLELEDRINMVEATLGN